MKLFTPPPYISTLFPVASLVLEFLYSSRLSSSPPFSSLLHPPSRHLAPSSTGRDFSVSPSSFFSPLRHERHAPPLWQPPSREFLQSYLTHTRVHNVIRHHPSQYNHSLLNDSPSTQTFYTREPAVCQLSPRRIVFERELVEVCRPSDDELTLVVRALRTISHTASFSTNTPVLSLSSGNYISKALEPSYALCHKWTLPAVDSSFSRICHVGFPRPLREQQRPLTRLDTTRTLWLSSSTPLAGLRILSKLNYTLTTITLDCHTCAPSLYHYHHAPCAPLIRPYDDISPRTVLLCLPGLMTHLSCPVPSAPESVLPTKNLPPSFVCLLVFTFARFRAAHDCDDTLYSFMISGTWYANDEPVTIQFYFSIYTHLLFSTCILACLPCLASKCGFNHWSWLSPARLCGEGRITGSVLLSGENEILSLRYSTRVGDP